MAICPIYISVIAELPHKEAATLTLSLRIPGSGGSFMQGSTDAALCPPEFVAADKVIGSNFPKSMI
jgi:hypothetical protein